MKIDFYTEKRKDVNISISASLENGELKLGGYDYGPTVERLRGMGDEFEYSLSLDKENSTKLFEAFSVADKTEKQKLETIKEAFSKYKGIFGLDNYCKENNIKTTYFSWP